MYSFKKGKFSLKRQGSGGAIVSNAPSQLSHETATLKEIKKSSHYTNDFVKLTSDQVGVIEILKNNDVTILYIILKVYHINVITMLIISYQCYHGVNIPIIL